MWIKEEIGDHVVAWMAGSIQSRRMLETLLSSPVALWCDQLQAHSIDISPYWLAVHDSGLGLEVSFKRFDHQRIVCTPKPLSDDPRTSAAYVLSQRQFCWERQLWTGKHHGHSGRPALLIPPWLHGHCNLDAVIMAAQEFKTTLTRLENVTTHVAEFDVLWNSSKAL